MPSSVVNDALSAAFCFGHNPQNQEELLAMLDIDRSGTISLDEFIRAARSAGDLERWLQRLPLASIISDAMSAALNFSSQSNEDNALRQVASVTSHQVSQTLAALCALLTLPLSCKGQWLRRLSALLAASAMGSIRCKKYSNFKTVTCVISKKASGANSLCTSWHVAR